MNIAHGHPNDIIIITLKSQLNPVIEALNRTSSSALIYRRWSTAAVYGNNTDNHKINFQGISQISGKTKFIDTATESVKTTTIDIHMYNYRSRYLR